MRSSMSRSCIMDEIFGSSASETFVRSTYEIVYMTSATGMMRSQRWEITRGWCSKADTGAKIK